MIKSQFVNLDSRLPLICSAIHAGHDIAADFKEYCSLSDAQRLKEEDPFTDQMAELFPNRITVQSSRFLVDLNRIREKSVYLKPDDCWGLPVQRENICAHLLGKLYQEYDQFYALVDAFIQRMLFVRNLKHDKSPLIVLDLHSYNHRRGGPEKEPDPQIENPDIIIGRSNLNPKHHPKAEALRSLLDGKILAGKAIDCRIDVKFPGGHFGRHLNSKFPDQLICLSIEFKKIFMDEHTGELDISVWKELQKVFYEAVMSFIKG